MTTPHILVRVNEAHYTVARHHFYQSMQVVDVSLVVHASVTMSGLQLVAEHELVRFPSSRAFMLECFPAYDEPNKGKTPLSQT